MKMQAMLFGNCCAICGYAESRVEEEVSPTRTGRKKVNNRLRRLSLL